MHYARLLLRIGGVCLRHPGTIGPALAAAWRFRARGWYRRPPFLPLPPGRYMAWRMDTAYGAEDALPSRAELERYLRWTRHSLHARRSQE
jgi:hypothetical protein